MTHEDAIEIIQILHNMEVTQFCIWLFTMVIMIMIAIVVTK